MRFAIVTDTHIRSPKGDLSSPFPVNEKANARAEYAVGMIAATNPAFTVHLGDVIHPLPHMPSAPDAIDEARRILKPLNPNLYFVPGNHDIGDKPSKLMPAGPVEKSGIEAYESLIGPQYQTFSYEDLQIFCINSSLINTGSEIEQQQRTWLEKELGDSRATVKILFSHYPPFVYNDKEADHYDNYAQPGRNWLLSLAAESGVNAIFSGHVHHFFYNRWQGIPLYCLPATSFTRQDYAELFPVSPANEYGRDDEGKFGITLVEVNMGAVSISIHNTYGRQGEYTGKPPGPPDTNSVIPHLRHTWHVPKALPYNGPMEEFGRKEARNDYPLLRLMQLGIKTVRVPGTDLLDHLAKARIADWLALDRKAVLFFTPNSMQSVLQACEDLNRGDNECIKAMEVLIRLSDKPEESINEISKAGSNIPIWLSAITTSADNPDPNRTFAHTVTSGVLPHQLTALAEMAAAASAQAVVMQVPWESELESTVIQAKASLQKYSLQLVVNLCFRKNNPAEANYDRSAIAERYAQALKIANSYPDLTLQIDTFEDIDRGYGPRLGFIDRLANLHEAFQV